MEWLILLTAFVHDIAVATYFGGAVAMEFILNPAQRAIPPAQAQIMGEKTSERFLIMVWISLVLIFVTGLMRLYFKGLIGGEPFFNASLSFDYAYGRTVFALLFIWVLLVVNGALITFVLRPRLTGKMAAGVSQAQAANARGSMMQTATWIERLTRLDLALAMLAVLLGASLLRGGLI